MKVVLILLFSVLAIACNRAAAPIANSERPINVHQQSNDAKSVLAHSSEGQQKKPVNGNTTAITTASPGGDPIDTSKFDEAIRNAEKNLQAIPADTELRKALGRGYFARGFALT